MTRKKRIRIILDTNFWISYLISDKIKQLDKKLFNKEIQIIFSEELFDEFLTVSQREKFKKYFNVSDTKKLIDLIEYYGKIIKVKSTLELCRDSKDNFLLNLAKDSKADFLVTGDEDLLELQVVERTKIISIKDLEQIFR